MEENPSQSKKESSPDTSDASSSSFHTKETDLIKDDTRRWKPSEDEKNCLPYYDFIKSVYVRFDPSFVVLFTLIFFNIGLVILIVLESLDLYKSYLDCEPGEVAVYKSIVFAPWALKVFFGLISDNVKIFGLKRKPYLIIMGFLQFVFSTSLYVFDPDNAMTATILLSGASFATCFQNVVIESLLVQ